MSNYQNLKNEISRAIRENGNQEITGDLLQEKLLEMVDSLGKDYKFRGIATPDGEPITDDTNVFYMANTVGAYPNYGGLAVADGEIAFLCYNGSWGKVALEDVARKSEVDAKIDNFASRLGVSGQMDINNEPTLLWLDISSWERKTYKLKITIVGDNAPSSIRVFQQQNYAQNNLDEITVYPNIWVDLTLVSGANFILFYCSDAFTYTLKYEIFTEEQVYKNTKDIEEVEKQLKQHNEAIDRLLEQTDGMVKTVDYEINPISTINSAYISDSKGTIKTDVGVYSILVYAVNPGEDYKIRLSSQVGEAKIYAIYDSTDTIDASTFVKGTNEIVTSTDEVRVRIPEGGKALAVTNYSPRGTVVVRKVYELLASPKDAAFFYSIKNEIIEVQKISGNDILCITLAKGGGNDLFDFRGFKKITEDGVENQFHYNDSDWFAPFKLDVINNADGDDTTADSFTGGAHQYNNSATGSTPTARMVDIEFKVDGRIITEGVGFAHNISMKWTNLIQANNTRKADGSGREVLKQIITLKFNGLEWNTETELIPLEDITMKTWYGYQMTGITSGLSNHWKFIGGANREDDVIQAGNNLACAIIAFGGAMDVRMELDTIFDIGDRRFCYEASTNSAFKSGNKGYFSIVNKPTEMKANQHYYIRGKYILTLNS